jgi:hypothetical protein
MVTEIDAALVLIIAEPFAEAVLSIDEQGKPHSLTTCSPMTTFPSSRTVGKGIPLTLIGMPASIMLLPFVKEGGVQLISIPSTCSLRGLCE